MFETWYNIAYSHKCIGNSYHAGENSRLAFSKTVTADRIRRPDQRWRRFAPGTGLFEQPEGLLDDFTANLPDRERVMK
jgi:hypothetical protein